MNRIITTIHVTGLALLMLSVMNVRGQTNGITKVKNDFRIQFQSVDLGKTVWTDGFMRDIWERNRDVTLPSLMERYNDPDLAGFALNFKNAADGTGRYMNGQTIFVDGDFYKYMEAILYVLAEEGVGGPWKTRLDAYIADIMTCQKRSEIEFGPDYAGFVGTFALIENALPDRPWEDRFGAEIYNLGHLMTTAAIHSRVTGESSLLDVGISAGQYISRIMHADFTEPQNYFDHVCVMGGVELYRETGNRTVYDVAAHIVDAKGTDEIMNPNIQDGIPFDVLKVATGHSQRANCIYAGTVDLFMEGANPLYLRSMETVWENMVNHKMYVTGGVASIHGFDPILDNFTPAFPNPPGEPVGKTQETHMSEALGPADYLPNEFAYNETCAQVSNLLFNWRLLQATGNARYADIIELQLLNGILSGVSHSGDKYFYTNKLERMTENVYQMDTRYRTGSALPTASEKFPDGWPDAMNAQCCAPNLARTIAMSPNLAYGVDDQNVWVHLYGSNHLQTTLACADSPVDIIQSAPGFPYSGKVTFTFGKNGRFGMKIRIPGWADGATVSIDGEPPVAAIPQSYHFIPTRTWTPSSTIELELHVDVEFLEPNPAAGDAQAGKTVVKLGPLIYCAESADNANLTDLAVDRSSTFTRLPNYIDASPAPEIQALKNEMTGAVLIPYFANSNRPGDPHDDPGDYFKVWLKESSRQVHDHNHL